MSVGRSARIVVSVLAASASLSACSTHGLAFRADDRVEIVHPHDGADVRLPVRLRWRSALGPGTYFAAFVDRAPIRPGESLRVLADETCDRTPRCFDLQYLRDRYVFVTDDESLVLETLPQTGTPGLGGRDRHEATIVLIDADGRRVGEAAYAIEFEVKER